MPNAAALRPLADAAELIRLRWVAVVIQLAAIGLAAAVGPWPPAAALAALVAVGVLTNVRLERRRHDIPSSWLAGLIALDAVLLTGMLILTGGALSPFSPLYLVYPVLAALLLPPRQAWTSLGLVLLAYVVLLFLTEALGATHLAHTGTDPMGHAVGMFGAVAVASPFLVATLLRARRFLTAADAQVARARVAEERSRRMASLATLAAGASHELATPLGTIAVAAGELTRKAEPGSSLAADAALIRGEVARCRRVLHELTADVGAGSGEQLQCVPVGDVVDLILEGHGDEIEVELEPDVEEECWPMPPRLVSQAIRRLLGNALKASPAGTPVLLRIDRQGQNLRIAVIDHGVGMTPEVLARAQEPFFSTRPEGVGMGLGLWFAQSVAEHLGGALHLTSSPGVGTEAIFLVPGPTNKGET